MGGASSLLSTPFCHLCHRFPADFDVMHAEKEGEGNTGKTGRPLLVTSASAAARLRALVGTLGGKVERSRAEHLLGGVVTVVPDERNPLIDRLANSTTVKEENKVIFGTGLQNKVGVRSV